MEKLMVVYCIEGELKSHFFRFENNALQYLDFIRQLYSAKLYRYNPDTDSWEAASN